jgi:hypothetical protein
LRPRNPVELGINALTPETSFRNTALSFQALVSGEGANAARRHTLHYARKQLALDCGTEAQKIEHRRG